MVVQMRLIDVDSTLYDLETWFDNLYMDGMKGTPRPMELSFSDAAEFINCQPIVDAVPVVHARWIDRPSGRYGQRQSWCSNCDKPSGIGGIESNRHKQYCPNCGARMDGDTDD